MAGGIAVADFGAVDTVRTLFVQPDGKILVGGFTAPVGSFIGSFALARFNADGTPDTSFDGDGKLTTAFEGSLGGYIWAIALGANGTILAGGGVQDSIGFVRYGLDGHYIETVKPDMGNFTFGRDLELQADGKILLLGRTANDFALVRLNGDGTPDAGFGGDGKAIADFGGNDRAMAIALEADGRLLVAGSTLDSGYLTGNFALARFGADGSLEGQVTIDMGMDNDACDSVAVQADGKIVLAGRSGYEFAVARLNADGSLDTSFDGDGKATVNVEDSEAYAHSMVIQGDGKILLAGVANNQFALARLNADGSPDAGFGNGGVIRSSIFGIYTGYGVALQADGKILLAGTGSNDFVLIRYNANGTVDTTFGTTHVGWPAGPGPASWEGGPGIDTVLYSGNRASYTFTATPSGFSLRDDGGAGDTDVFMNIERVKFADVMLAFDVTSMGAHAGEVAKILGAVFGTPAVSNQAYAGIGISLRDAGMGYADLGALAVAATGSSSFEDVVQLLWGNVVGTSIPAAEKSHFVGLLEGGMSVGVLTAMAADTSFNISNVDLVGLARTGLAYQEFAG
ncbi:MAG: hypothetical protein JWQ07_2212 [Ramlibacter sp.]|nr:hypothetical protein [Ramlibacter sp.]